MEESGSAGAGGGESMEGSEGHSGAEDRLMEDGEGEEQRQQQKRKTPKMRRIKVNGAEEYVDEDEVFRDYQKYRGSEVKMREAAKMRETAEQLFQTLMQDPATLFDDPRLAKHKRALLERWAPQIYDEDTREVDPREQQLQELQARLKEFEDRDKKVKETEIQKQQREFIESRKAAISGTLAEAMKATHLSQHPESAAQVLREMVLYMRKAKEGGYEVTPDELVEHVHNSRFTQMYTLAHQMQGDELLEFLGDEVVNRIRKADLARLKKSRETPVQQWRTNEPRQLKSGNDGYIDPNDVRFSMRSFR